MFTPPFCPYGTCSQHLDPEKNFYRGHGSYRPVCRPRPVPRFRCQTCGRTFSRQTFRSDFRDRRPDLNAPLIDLITMGVGIRMSSRRLGLSLRCTELKLRKIAKHLAQQNATLRQPLKGDVEFQFDEIETFETHRSMCPVSVPVLIEKNTRYCVAAKAAPIRPKGKMTPERLEKIAIWDAKPGGPRVDGSRAACVQVLQSGAELLGGDVKLTLFTDEKTTYPVLAKAAFGEKLTAHHTTSSELARTTWNPLFPINHEDARMRDIMGRMRRQSWLVSKRREYLDLALHVHAAHRNYVRPRFNGEKVSAAQMLGFVHRRMTLAELLSWSQCWGKRSPHPLSKRAVSVAAYETAMLAKAQ